MSKYYKFLLKDSYDFVGKFSALDDEHEYGGLVKCRPGYVISLQLAVGFPRDKESSSNMFWGHIFEDGQPPMMCTLVDSMHYNRMAGLRSGGGVKESGAFQFLVLGGCFKAEEIVTEYIYSSKLIQHFFCPHGAAYEKFNSEPILFSFADSSVEVWQYATMQLLDWLRDGEIVSKSDEFRDKLKSLVEKYTDERGIAPGIKSGHLWGFSIKKEVPVSELGSFASISKSLDDLLFILVGHQSSPIGLKIKVQDLEKDKDIAYDVIRPIYDGFEFDEGEKDEDPHFILYHPITIKSLGIELFEKIVAAWKTNEDRFHYILHVLKSNYGERKNLHAVYAFARTVGALEALHDLDRVRIKGQNKQIQYAIENYASEKIKSFLEDACNSDKKIENALVIERAKIVHPPTSDKDVWDNQQLHYNLTIAMEAILFRFLQKSVGVPDSLLDQFQEKMIERLAWE
jgi:hypothetical protein